MSYIVKFDSPRAHDFSYVGAKAVSIANLIDNGAITPSGFVIPSTVFSKYMSPVVDEVNEVLKTVRDDAVSAFHASDSVMKLIEPLEVPRRLKANVSEQIESTQHTYAVRSSATAEDLETASFAGVYDTFLDATNSESIIVRVRDVWASYYAGRAISYRSRIGIPQDSGLMAVIVMELINADSGGVVFTCDPRDGSDQIIVNASLGLGEGVVSGSAEVDSFTLRPDSFEITSRNVIDKKWMIVSGKDGTILRIPVPADKRSEPALTDIQLVDVALLASKIKSRAGDDRDIEFAVRDDIVHVLQSRPIVSAVIVETAFPVKWNYPQESEFHWTRDKPTPILPLYTDYISMAGVAEKRSVDATGQYMGRRDLKKIVNGYLFTAESPRDPKDLKSRLNSHHQMGLEYLRKGTTFFYEKIEPLLRERLAALDRSRPSENAELPMLVENLRETTRAAADHQADLHWRSWAGFKEQESALKLFSRIAGRPEVEGAGLTPTLDHMTTRLVSRLIRMARLVQSDRWLSDRFQNRDYDPIFERGTANRLAVRKFRSRFRSMLKIWGRRNGIGYGSAWKPNDPTWNMKPEIALDSIGSFVQQDLDELNIDQKRLRIERISTIRSIRRKIGSAKKLRHQFDFELFKASQHVKMMENHNYLIEQCTFGEYRESINRVGVRLAEKNWTDEADDVFFLRLSELEDAADTGDCSVLRSLVETAKCEFAENSKLNPPEYLGIGPSEKDQGVDDEDARSLRGLSPNGSTLHGEPSSPGSFTGTARVVMTRTAAPPNIINGEILVTDNTGPDWLPVFPLLGALVLNEGANFQHASLLCREYGIPCVIQTKEATSHITNGQVITVDATTGTITLNPIV